MSSSSAHICTILSDLSHKLRINMGSVLTFCPSTSFNILWWLLYTIFCVFEGYWWLLFWWLVHCFIFWFLSAIDWLYSCLVLVYLSGLYLSKQLAFIALLFLVTPRRKRFQVGQVNMHLPDAWGYLVFADEACSLAWYVAAGVPWSVAYDSTVHVTLLPLSLIRWYPTSDLCLVSVLVPWELSICRVNSRAVADFPVENHHSIAWPGILIIDEPLQLAVVGSQSLAPKLTVPTTGNPSCHPETIALMEPPRATWDTTR